MPRKRRRSTWGSNEDAGGGRRRLRFWADLHDGRGYVRHSVTIVGSRRDGDEELARIRVEHASDAPVPTVGEAYERWWLPGAEQRLADGELSRASLDNYRSRWRAHVSPRWSGVPVTDVRPLDVQDWLSTMTSTIATTSLQVLAQVLDLCVLYEVADHNPARSRYRMPRGSKRQHDRGVYTLSELTRALDAVRGTPAYLPAVMCGLASCRVGESLGPRIDLGEVWPFESDGMTLAVVDVRRQIDKYDEPVERLKNSQSVRPVIVPEPWSSDVLAQEGPWLCDDGCGNPLSQRLVNRVWRETLSDAGIGPIQLRNLRSSWRTIMRWELGVPEDMVEAMMGHAGRNVGEVHYDRPRWEEFAATVAGAWARHRASE